MGEWISEHKAISIIIAVVLGLAIIVGAVFGVKAIKSNNKKAEDEPSQSVGSTSEDVWTDDFSETTSETETESQTDISGVTTTETTTRIEATTGAVSTTVPQTTKPMQTVPTGVEVKTDGNKKVYYPAALQVTSKKYPVVVWANGTGCATETYDGLLKKIADAGYIVVADSSVMTADGTAQRNSIDYIIGQGGNSSSVFYGKVDSSRVGATGHSQGGRSSVNAAQADSRIKCIVSIAGASSAEEANGLKTPSLFLTGTSDMVVVSSQWCKPSYDAVAGRAVYASLKGGVHTTCMTNPEKVAGYVVSWFDAYLKGDGTAKATFANGGKLSTDSAWTDFACKN